MLLYSTHRAEKGDDGSLEAGWENLGREKESVMFSPPSLANAEKPFSKALPVAPVEQLSQLDFAAARHYCVTVGM